jgi:hypothetical protein
MTRFKAVVEIVGINPFVQVPDSVLKALFRQAQREKGPIPVKGRLQGKPFLTTVVLFRGRWRLYLNTQMRKDAGVDVGDEVTVEIAFDPQKRVVPMPPRFARALAQHPKVKAAFESLAPSRRTEILRYLNWVKTEEALDRNVDKILRILSKPADRP